MLPASGLDDSSGVFCKDMGPCGYMGLKTCPHGMGHLPCRPALPRRHVPKQRSSKEFDTNERYTKHLAKKCVKDAGPCLALCLAGAAVALLAVLGPFDVLRSASSLHVCMALAGAMMTGGVLDLIFWVLDPFGWKNEG